MAVTSKALDEMLDQVNKAFGPGGRIEQIERSVHGLGKGSTEATAVLQKALLQNGAPGQYGMMGWDGADSCSLLSRSSKTKTIGSVAGKNFGEWLQWVAGAAPNCPGISRSMESVEKAMKDYGSRSVNKVANAESSGGAGGYLVPPQFYAKLLQFVAEKSFVKAMCTTLPMTAATLQFPYLNQAATTASSASNYISSNFFGGTYAAWSPEAATAAQSNPTFKQGTLTARTLLVQTLSSMQLIQDSFVALDGLITTLLADSIAWQLDYAFLRGSGVNQPLGIANASGTISSSRTGGGSTFTLASAAAMLSRAVMSDNFDGLVWVMSQSVLPQLVQMVNNTASNASLVWLNQYTGGAQDKLPMKLFGIPIYFTEKCPVLGTAGDVMLLDMTKYLCGDRMNVQIEASPFPYFTTYQMVWRAVWRGDGQPWFDSAITLADGTTTVSPHIILAA